MKSFKKVAMVLAIIMTFSVFPSAALAADITGGVDENNPAVEETQGETEVVKTIVSISQLSQSTLYQSMVVRSGKDVDLPQKITATTNDGEVLEIPVTWNSSSFNGNQVGTYYFEGKLDTKLPLAESVSLPKITVSVTKTSTHVSDLALKIKRKSRGKINDTVIVSNAYGRTLKLQLKQKGKWYTKKSYKLENSSSDKIKISYPTHWWKLPKTYWRVVVTGTHNDNEYVSPTITVNTTKYYQTPGRYFKVKSYIPVRKSGYTLKVGMSGMKVYTVQKKLRCYNGKARYTRATASKVKRFQRKHHLRVTGEVDYKTWRKMGFSKHSWYYMDSYVTPIKVNMASTKKQHVDAIVNTAKSYLGTKYVWCASGKRKQGVDCAGLVIQCLYAAGIDIAPYGSYSYAHKKNEYLTRKLWKDKRFKHVKFSQKKKGDIIFYHDKGVIVHVAVYVGGGKQIEALGQRVWKLPVRGKVKGVVRPIV